MKKTFIKALASFFSWESILMMVFRASVGLFREWVKLTKISRKARMLVQIIFVGTQNLGPEWARETSNKEDDKVIKELNTLAKDIAKIHNFGLPTVPDVGH